MEKDNSAPDFTEEPPKSSLEDTSPIKIEDKAVKVPKRWRVVLLGIFILLVLASAGSGLGYYSGIQKRIAYEESQHLNVAATHYQNGMQAMLAGNYELAKVQFEYVIQLYPDFPGITEKYSEAVINSTKASWDSAAPTPAPARNVEGAEALFQQALTEIFSQQWAAALNTLQALRDEDYTYRTLEADGLYWIALRYAAVDKINKEGDLEGGLYYLALAEKFAPLDHDAVNYALWARMYITGASFWDVDWKQVIYYFEQVYNASPYMYDGSRTAKERYRVGLLEYGKLLLYVTQENCQAEKYLRTCLNVQYDQEVEQLVNEAYLLCLGPTETPTPEITATPQETPTETIEPTPTKE